MRPIILAAAAFALLALPASAQAGSWRPDPELVGIGASPDLFTNRTVAAPDGTVTQIVEGGTPPDIKTAVEERPPGGSFDAVGFWDGGFGSVVGGPDGSVAVVTYENLDPAHPATAKAYVRVKRPGGDFSAKTQVGTGLPSVTPGFVGADGTFWAITNDAGGSTVKLVRVAPDGSVKTDPLIALDPGDKVVVTSLLRLPNGGARMAFSLRNDHQDDVNGKCVRDTALLAKSVAPDGTLSPFFTMDQGRATDDKGVLNCDQVGHGYTDPGSHQVFPHVMTVSPGGETSLVASDVTITPDGKTQGGVARASGPADKDFDAFDFRQIFDGLAQPIGVAYAGEDPVVLMTNSAGGSSLLLTQRIAGGPWTAPTLLSSKPDQFPAIVGSADGRALIALFDIPPVGQTMQPGTIRAYIRNPDGMLDPVVSLQDQVLFRGVWADGAGDLGATMEGDGDPGPAYIPFTLLGVYDGAPPKLSVGGPAGGTAGQSLDGFTATATDIWSGIPNPPSWTFSGGGDASGTPVSHTFGSAGHQTATAAVTDAAGNTATAGTGLDIAAAPVPAPPPAPSAPVVGAAKDTTKPVVTKLRITFDRRTHVATLKFTLSEDATVKLTIKRKGVKRVLTITKKLKRGLGSMRTTRLNKRVRYTFTIVATDAAKNTSKLAQLTRTFR